MTAYKDYPKAELIAGAEGAIRRYAAAGFEAHAFFKATCPRCKARPMFSVPDTCFDTMECSECGHDFPFVKGNYAIMVKGDPDISPDEALRVMEGR